ncbi:MAG: PQQ-dependent sugar dehydrogenase [Gemmatimonadaceae bacterium]
MQMTNVRCARRDAARRARRLALACVLAAAPGVALRAGPVGAQEGAGAAAPAVPLDSRLTVPAGFKVDYFARGVGGVRFMALSPEGVVYATRTGPGQVVRLPDDNRDGMADSVVIVARGLRSPHGLAFHKGYLYVANTDGVVRMRLGADGRAAGEPEKLNSYSAGGGHFTRTIVFGADGAMYVSIGSSCNLCVEEKGDRAAVMRYDEDGENGRLYARGLRNAVGLAVHPDTRQIWVSTHERDNLRPEHEDLPPEEIDILRDGGDFGWPYCYSSGGRPVANPEYNDPARCSRTVTAALEMQAHSAPMGLAFLKGASQFPREYRGDVLLAFHGSWNRSTPTGAKIVRVRVKDGKPASYEDFVTGWQGADGRRWGRPVDVLVHKDGSVLISDDAGGAIYRVSH